MFPSFLHLPGFRCPLTGLTHPLYSTLTWLLRSLEVRSCRRSSSMAFDLLTWEKGWERERFYHMGLMCFLAYFWRNSSNLIRPKSKVVNWLSIYLWLACLNFLDQIAPTWIGFTFNILSVKNSGQNLHIKYSTHYTIWNTIIDENLHTHTQVNLCYKHLLCLWNRLT